MLASTCSDAPVRKHGDDNGFEGNAQSFRILTKLVVRFVECTGLDLTRAVLAACLKYPWLRDASQPNRSKKWGAYDSEREDFEFGLEDCLGIRGEDSQKPT